MNPSALRIFTISSLRRDDGTSTVSCRALRAFRMRVSMSAIGSVITPTPHTSPAGLDEARDLPPVRQRPQADPAQAEFPEDRARAAASTSPASPSWPSLRSPPDDGHLADRSPEGGEELGGLLVGPRRRHDGDVHPPDLVDLVVVDLREDELFPDPDVEVPPPVAGPDGQPLEVLDPRQGDVEELIEELVHPLPPERHLAPDGVARPQLEGRDGPPGAGDHRPLAADEHELLHRLVQVPLVLEGVRHPHVDDHLLDPGHLHDVAVAEPRPQPGDDLRLVPFA